MKVDEAIVDLVAAGPRKPRPSARRQVHELIMGDAEDLTLFVLTRAADRKNIGPAGELRNRLSFPLPRANREFPHGIFISVFSGECGWNAPQLDGVGFDPLLLAVEAEVNNLRFLEIITDLRYPCAG
jgi:hypothetical protein